MTAPGIGEPAAPVARGRGDQALVPALEPADEVVGATALEASDRVDVLHLDDDLTPECLREHRVGELWCVQKRRVDQSRRFLDSLQRKVRVHAESPLTDSNRRPPPYHGSSGAVTACTPNHPRSRLSCRSNTRECRQCPPVTARAQADVPVWYPRRVVCFQNTQLRCGCTRNEQHHPHGRFASLTLSPQPRRRSRVAGSDQGDLDGEPRADASVRFDVERSIDRCDSLPHSDKPQRATAYLR